MIAKLKKTSTKPALKKKIVSKPITSKSVIQSSPPSSKESLPLKSSLHRMLTAEGWKRIMLKKD